MEIKNINDEYLDVEVIRYFINDNTKYLIYSLNEVDASGYIKLYASKIQGSKAVIIADEDEWDEVKQVIKEIVRSNRDGSELDIIDLSEEDLEDVVLQDTRVFKLQGNLVTLLAENKHVAKHESEPISDEIIDDSVDYETMYNEQLNKNNELQNEIAELNETIEKYKSMIDNIKSLIND